MRYTEMKLRLNSLIGRLVAAAGFEILAAPLVFSGSAVAHSPGSLSLVSPLAVSSYSVTDLGTLQA